MFFEHGPNFAKLSFGSQKGLVKTKVALSMKTVSLKQKRTFQSENGQSDPTSPLGAENESFGEKKGSSESKCTIRAKEDTTQDRPKRPVLHQK